MNKKLFALLTALCCMSAMTLTAFAGEYGADPDGYLSYITTFPYSGVLVETDGTELTEEMVSMLDGYQALYDWEEYCNGDYAWSYLLTDVVPEGTAYMLTFDSSELSELSTRGRQLILNLDCIENVQFVTRTECQPALMKWQFTVETKNSDIVLDENSIPELSEFTCNQFTYGSTSDSTVYIYRFSGDETNSVLFPDFTSGWDGQQSYEAYQLWNEYAQNILDKYADILSSVRVDTYLLDAPSSYTATATPIWQTAGDHNADGEVNSNDAADLLVQAAQDGVAEASETAVSPDSDVNLDGVADSTDAAYILQYAALKGSGADADWVEILKK